MCFHHAAGSQPTRSVFKQDGEFCTFILLKLSIITVFLNIGTWQKSRQQCKTLQSHLSSARSGNVLYSQDSHLPPPPPLPRHYFDINFQKAEAIILALPFATEIQPHGCLPWCGSHFVVYAMSQISNPKDESVFSKSCYSILLRCGTPKQGMVSPTVIKSILSTATCSIYWFHLVLHIHPVFPPFTLNWLAWIWWAVSFWGRWWTA